MKKIIAGIAILSTGYGIALFFPPDQIPFLKHLNLSLLNVENVKSVAEETKKVIETQAGVLKEIESTPNDSESKDLESKIAENPTYLREIDLFQIPGLGADFSLRVGPPLPEAAAKKLIEKLPTAELAYGARFQTATGAARVIVLYGKLENKDQAELLRDSLQQRIPERLEVVYLPECVSEGDTDDDGFYCGEALSEATLKSAEPNPSTNA